MKALPAVAVAELVAIVLLAVLWSQSGARAAGEPPDPVATPASGSPAQPVVGSAPAPGREAEPPASREDIADDDPVGVVLHGTVRNAGGVRPVERAQVQLTAGVGGNPLRAMLVDPAFAFPGLTAGTWKLRVEAAGFEPYEADVSLASGPRLQQHDVDLTAAMVVKVALLTPEGTPLLQAEGVAAKLLSTPIEVVATAGEPPERLDAPLLPSRTINPARASWRPSGGRVPGGPRLSKRHAGELTLRQPPPAWVAAYLGVQRLAAVQLPALQDEVVLTVDPKAIASSLGAVTFRVVAAEDGSALAAAHASLSNRFGIRPDAQGVVRTADLMPGRYELAVMAPERAQHGAVLELSPGQTLDLGEIALERALDVWRGSVVDDAGKPVPARIRLRPLDEVDPWLGLAPGPAAVADAAGAFALDGLRAARYLVLASDEGNQQMAIAVLDATGRRAPLDLRLQPTAALQMKTRLAGLASMRVLVCDGAGQPVSGHVLAAGQPLSLRLPPGTYLLEVSTERGRSRRVHVALAAGGSEVVLE